MNERYNLIIPMAGLGSRFSKAGYKTPKPLLPIGPFRMFEIVITNLMSSNLNEISLIVPKKFDLKKDCLALSRLLSIRIHVVEVDDVTDGPATSALLGLEKLDCNLPLVIANSDQYLDIKIEPWLSAAVKSGIDGSILCMQDDSPKWSYVEIDHSNQVKRVVEKQVISKFATCGVYFFGKGSDFELGALRQRELGERVNGEFYVGPVYNQLIRIGKRVEYLDMGPVNGFMFGLGTPEDYEFFLKSGRCNSAIEQSLEWVPRIIS